MRDGSIFNYREALINITPLYFCLSGPWGKHPADDEQRGRGMLKLGGENPRLSYSTVWSDYFQGKNAWLSCIFSHKMAQNS
jgi:hypothetical protein